MIQLKLENKELDNNHGGGGVEIRVPGLKGNPVCPEEGQIFLEIYQGKMRVLVWNGSEEPEYTIEQELS